MEQALVTTDVLQNYSVLRSTDILHHSYCLSFTVSSSPIICSSSTQVTTSIGSSTQLIISVAVTFLLTCVCAFVISSLLCFLVMKRLLKAKALRNQLRVPHGIEPMEKMYEMVNTEKTAEAVYDFIDEDKKRNVF